MFKNKADFSLCRHRVLSPSTEMTCDGLFSPLGYC